MVPGEPQNEPRTQEEMLRDYTLDLEERIEDLRGTILLQAKLIGAYELLLGFDRVPERGPAPMTPDHIFDNEESGHG